VTQAKVWVQTLPEIMGKIGKQAGNPPGHWFRVDLRR